MTCPMCLGSGYTMIAAIGPSPSDYAPNWRPPPAYAAPSPCPARCRAVLARCGAESGGVQCDLVQGHDSPHHGVEAVVRATTWPLERP